MTTSNHARGAASRALRSGRLAIALGAVLVAACGQPSPAAKRSPAAVPMLSEAEIRDLDIAFHAERARRDPTGGADLARLGALYLERGRVSGDPRDVVLAAEAALHSLRNRGSHNTAARSVLQASLVAQHRFAEALTLAQEASAAEPEKASLRAAVGEIQMELGQYDSARASFANLRVSLGDLAVAPRLARWMEIQGQPDRARRLLRAALSNALREPSMPREQLAWYWLRVGDVELRTGRFAAADSAYAAGLATHPGDHRLLSALGHSALVQHRWPEAIAFGERAIGQTLDPTTLGMLSDAYAAVGDSAKSAEYARALEVTVLQQPGEYHRAWSLFLLDHDRQVATVTRKIREELRSRRDVYAYDLLAWALHRQGRHLEARSAMREALRQGTRDALLFRHAAAIEAALGDAEAAAGYSARAYALNPYLGAARVASVTMP